MEKELFEIWQQSGLMAGCPEAVRLRAVKCLCGYFDDLVQDLGLWRVFILQCRNLYGRTLPFFEVGDDYVDFELNEQDVHFLLWYAVAMVYEPMRALCPLDEELTRLARLLHEVMERHYDEAQVPGEFPMAHELEMNNPEDSQKILELADWLFLRSYLLTPAFALSLGEIVAESRPDGKDNIELLRKNMEEAMSSLPTGPLALYLREWLWLMVEGKLPPAPKKKGETTEHPYYQRFMTDGGSPVRIFSSYEEMNNFFIEVLGWEKGVNHLDNLQGAHDYVLMVNPERGLLVARDVARCFKAPGNSLYDPEYAREHAINLLTVRGACPADLLRYALKHDWLADATFPGTDNHTLVADNADFIARCYLQLYYRD